MDNINKYNVLLVNANLIKSLTNISDNTADGYILPSIALAQDIDLESVIGTQLKEALQEIVYGNLINTDGYSNYKLLLDKYIQPFLTYTTICYLIPTVAHKIANAGILRTDDEKMTNVTTNEVDKVKSYYQHLADVYKNRLQRYLIAEYNTYPELMQWKSVASLRANLYSSASCGLNLGGARGKKL